MDSRLARHPHPHLTEPGRRATAVRQRIRDDCAAARYATTAPDRWAATSHEGLRRALLEVQGRGWGCDAGRAIVAELEQRSRSWACLADRRCARRPGTTDPADVVAVAWLTLEKSAAKVVAVQRPWAYLWTVVGNALAREALADSRLSDSSRIRSHSPGPATVVRVGLEAAVLDAAEAAGSVSDAGTDSASPQVRELARRLSADEDELDFWLDAIGRALDVMADARRSYEEYQLRRDPYMLDHLGLSPEELSALAALLIGPRKGDRAAQSLLLAMHRNIEVHTEDVPGASARVRLLRSRAGRAACPAA